VILSQEMMSLQTAQNMGNSEIDDAWISSIAPQPTEHNRKSLHKYPRIKRLNFVDNLSLINRQAKVETFDGSSLFQLRSL
jgi:pantothenate kinase type III